MEFYQNMDFNHENVKSLLNRNSYYLHVHNMCNAQFNLHSHHNKRKLVLFYTYKNKNYLLKIIYYKYLRVFTGIVKSALLLKWMVSLPFNILLVLFICIRTGRYLSPPSLVLPMWGWKHSKRGIWHSFIFDRFVFDIKSKLKWLVYIWQLLYLANTPQG